MPVLVVSVLLLHVVLGPVDVGGFGGKSADIVVKFPVNGQLVTLPANVSSHEHDAGPHDDEERLESDVVLEGLDSETLGRCDVVQLPPSLAHQVGVVSSIEKLGEKHLKTEQTLLTANWW